MNIHDAVLQPIAAFVYCNRHAVAGRRRRTNVGNFRTPAIPAGACATNSAHGRDFAKVILWWNHAWNKIILGRSTDGGRARVWNNFISAWNHV